MYTLKKSLGQHFLKDDKIIQKIIAALQEHPFQNLLEVGPGAGALTKHLIKLQHVNFKAVELDQEKVRWRIGLVIIPMQSLSMPINWGMRF